MKRIIMAACIVSLAACGGDKDDVATEQQQDWESRKQSLVYSFPDHQQQQVPVPSPVVLRFSSPVVETSPAVVLREVGGPIVTDFEMEWVDGKRGLIIKPDSKLKPMTEYVVQVPAIELEKGVAPARNIRFSTRALFEGPKSLVASDTFEVTRMIPDGENYQVMDFSSFRVQFSQPLDRTTVKYGNGADATVQLMGPAGLVDAHLLVSGHYMTIDPKEDLTPGAEYSLNMTTGITSTYGETLPGGSFGNPGDTLAVSVKVSPQDTKAPGTGLRVSMVQDVADTGELSPLTGQPINLVPMASVLLGEDTATQASGTVAAELAFVPNFPDATPFRVKRGSLIEGASIEVLIGGHVPAGFESGKVRMDFLSDAVGYLLPNPYSNSDDAPRQVRLFMDVAVSTETPSANGAITQDLLHIELVGTSIVEDGVMVINAVGVVEPDVLGSERAVGVLSFYMKAFEDQDNPPPLVDSKPLEVQSWFPGSEMGSMSISDPVVVNFNKALSSSLLLNESVKVMGDEEPISVQIVADGAALIIKNRDGWERGVEYSVLLEGGIEDINGNGMASFFIGRFEFPTLVEKAEEELKNLSGASLSIVDRRYAPIILSIYPGYPCSIVEDSWDFPNNIAGKCSGYLQGWSEGTPNDMRLADDIVPLQNLPANHPIIVNFSKDIDPFSVGIDTFKVFRLENGERYPVDGRIVAEAKKIMFWPDFEWMQDSIYGYEIFSNGDFSSPAVDCNNSICDKDGFALQTQLWRVETRPYPAGVDRTYITQHFPTAPRAGGPNMIFHFRGGEKSKSVIQNLSAESADRNSNFRLDKPSVWRDELAWENNATFAGYIYTNEVFDGVEIGAEFQPRIQDVDENTYPGQERSDIDPNGVVPPDNSAKILSLKINDPVSIEDIIGGSNKYIAAGLNVGCGYDDVIPDASYFFGKAVETAPCPKEKFTFLSSSIIAEITDLYIPGKGVMVKIWPGQIMATSVAMRVPSITKIVAPESGPQVMRMRFSKNDPECEDEVDNPCVRNKPISGWIYQAEDGQPFLKANVDLYIDAHYLLQEFERTIGLINIEHDLLSYPISMALEGPVDFNSDGTMRVTQYNVEDIVIDFMFSSTGNHANNIEIMIPSYGSKLVYESDVIKK